ncbi:Membrane-anchored ubiquitin-fold protein [Musa troglodytarum]|uniref:Membrane-anchored ubiquitin-fold protein n=1 Tax=Musa troglodytarum TaxID=320322 RepID=A0A9E7FGM2_9LILI|nr:Membrane-anchored ubiquitin-fold protein [Musa troglodytarum]
MHGQATLTHPTLIPQASSGKPFKIKEKQPPKAEAQPSPSPSLSPRPSIPRFRTPNRNSFRLTFANPSLDLAIASPSLMPEEDLVELRFRLYDGSDIGPICYSSSSTVAMLKERIISEWPRDYPKLANDVKLIRLKKYWITAKQSLSADQVLVNSLEGLSLCMLLCSHRLLKLKQRRTSMSCQRRQPVPVPYCRAISFIY